jgi:hypothetical protein
MKHLILTILFTLSFFAQEVGVPYVQLPKDAKELNIGLSRDGKTFYTYENNTLIHWNMNPVQIIDSVKITESKYASPINYDLSVDETKIVFSDRRVGVGLLDLKTKQFIKKLPIQFRFDTLVRSNLITVDKDRTITVRNLSNLSEITKQIKIPEIKVEPDCECSDDVWLLLKSHDEKILAIITNLRILLLDTNTLNMLSEIKGFFPDRGTYINYTSKGEIIQASDDMFNLSTLKSIRAGDNDFNVISREHLNLKHSLYWYKKKIDKASLGSSTNVLSLSKSKTIFQFPDNNWLISTSDGYFDGSYEARKYLYVKTSSGKSVPIDDTTFQKFHKKINLKD